MPPPLACRFTLAEAAVLAWLAAHPEVEIVCRDRGSGYREGATKGVPQALQISDRRHLLENATAAFVEGVKRTHPAKTAGRGCRLRAAVQGACW